MVQFPDRTKPSNGSNVPPPANGAGAPKSNNVQNVAQDRFGNQDNGNANPIPLSDRIWQILNHPLVEFGKLLSTVWSLFARCFGRQSAENPVPPQPPASSPSNPAPAGPPATTTSTTSPKSPKTPGSPPSPEEMQALASKAGQLLMNAQMMEQMLQIEDSLNIPPNSPLLPEEVGVFLENLSIWQDRATALNIEAEGYKTTASESDIAPILSSLKDSQDILARTLGNAHNRATITTVIIRSFVCLQQIMNKIEGDARQSSSKKPSQAEQVKQMTVLRGQCTSLLYILRLIERPDVKEKYPFNLDGNEQRKQAILGWLKKSYLSNPASIPLGNFESKIVACQPGGLHNNTNSCYINSTVQTLYPLLNEALKPALEKINASIATPRLEGELKEHEESNNLRKLKRDRDVLIALDRAFDALKRHDSLASRDALIGFRCAMFVRNEQRGPMTGQQDASELCESLLRLCNADFQQETTIAPFDGRPPTTEKEAIVSLRLKIPANADFQQMVNAVFVTQPDQVAQRDYTIGLAGNPPKHMGFVTGRVALIDDKDMRELEGETQRIMNSTTGEINGVVIRQDTESGFRLEHRLSPNTRLTPEQDRALTALVKGHCRNLAADRLGISFQHNNRKRSEPIAFPADRMIDLKAAYKSQQPIQYKITSFIEHISEEGAKSANGGHYAAYRFNEDEQQWYCFNDDKVTRLSLDQALVKMRDAYFVFTERVMPGAQQHSAAAPESHEVSV